VRLNAYGGAGRLNFLSAIFATEGDGLGKIL
jgi:hypothetical protein